MKTQNKRVQRTLHKVSGPLTRDVRSIPKEIKHSMQSDSDSKSSGAPDSSERKKRTGIGKVPFVLLILCLLMFGYFRFMRSMEMSFASPQLLVVSTPRLNGQMYFLKRGFPDQWISVFIKSSTNEPLMFVHDIRGIAEIDPVMDMGSWKNIWASFGDYDQEQIRTQAWKRLDYREWKRLEEIRSIRRLSRLDSDWYDNGQIKSQISYKDGKWDGEWITWYEDGKIASKRHFKSEHLHGLSESWYPNGQKEYEISYDDGMAVGTCTFWYPDGRISGEARHNHIGNDYIETGTTWHTNGLIKTQYRRKNGLLHMDEWDENGNLIEKAAATSN